MNLAQQANLYTTNIYIFGYLKQWANQFPNNTLYRIYQKSGYIDLRMAIWMQNNS